MWCCPISLILCVPKVPFRVFTKLKNKIRIIFMLNRFSCWIDFYFEYLMPSFDFHFHKKMENEIQFFFHFSFSWKKWKNNYLKIKIDFTVIFTSIVHTLFKSKFVSDFMRFSAVQWPRGQCCTMVTKATDVLLAATFIFALFL